MDLPLIISIISVIATTFSAIVATVMAIFTYQNLSELKFARIESSRAYINLNFVRIQRKNGWRIVLKNYGQSPGTLKRIIVNPPLSVEKVNCLAHEGNRKFLTEATNIYLAPGQAITDAFLFNQYQDCLFHVTVEYETLGKSYSENYDIDLTFREEQGLPVSQNSSIEDSLNKIAENSEWFFERYP